MGTMQRGQADRRRHNVTTRGLRGRRGREVTNRRSQGAGEGVRSPTSGLWTDAVPGCRDRNEPVLRSASELKGQDKDRQTNGNVDGQ